MLVVTQALLCERHTTGRLGLEQPLRACRFSEEQQQQQQRPHLEAASRTATKPQRQEVSGSFAPQG